MTFNNQTFHVNAGDFEFRFLNSGDIYSAKYKSTLLNRLLTNSIDGSLNNLYLRIYRDDDVKVYPMLGVRSQSKVRYGDKIVSWTGTADSIRYQVIFTLLQDGIWFWDVSVSGNDVDIDVIFGQDLGLALEGAVRSNEAFVGQYIDHKVFRDDVRGFVVCSRQNQPQDGAFPYIQHGCLTNVIGYSTDGFQFYGQSYKATNEPEVLKQSTLANEIYQYEFAYTALQSKRKHIAGTEHIVFYGMFKEDHPSSITQLEYYEDIESAWAHVQQQGNHEAPRVVETVTISSRFDLPLCTAPVSLDEIHGRFPNRHEEEWDKATLLSFFTDTHEHVVLKEKEVLVERPHGHILMTGNNDRLVEGVLTSTSFMNGVFNSQLTVGNTSFHKMITNTRDALNIMKTPGQRVYIEMDGKYRLLALPSMFELGLNYARWYYKTEDDMIIVTNFTVFDSPEIRLNVKSTAGKTYRYLVTSQVSMNNEEYNDAPRTSFDGVTLSVFAGEDSDSSAVYPNLCYRQRLFGAHMIVRDERVFSEHIAPGSCSLMVFELSETSEWTLATQGLLHGEELPFMDRRFESEVERFRTFYKTVMNGFHVSHPGPQSAEIDKVNDVAWWFTHNMLVHFSVPHGLEQYGGAAWGTRDVCQGPAEYFLATQHYETVREILQTVYAHQYQDDGNWPQWFMFDAYHPIQQEESHGDIIVWPLKVLADYIVATNDHSILNQQVPYSQRETHAFTSETATIFNHVKKQIEYIKRHFAPGTHLSMYGDGDWDDTLQPADPQLKQRLISTWTVALTYQVLGNLSVALERVDKTMAMQLHGLSENIAEDFHGILSNSNVIPGFVHLNPNGNREFLLHPTDKSTGIRYRLLPMTRSIIGELLTPEQAAVHDKIIQDEMYSPDGVRLMSTPARYNGGVSVHFKRAEQAANFGREVGLQYVHAHIRYVEAMAKLGKADEAWRGLQVVNPIGIQKVVPNAARRQSNTYFSSSDGKFLTRYDAEEQFAKLRTGTVDVKGGWRIYSSGPGIYMNQLISNVLGIKSHFGDLIIDPVLPPTLDGLRFEFHLNGIPVVYVYHLTGPTLREVVINGKSVPLELATNHYRAAGCIIRARELDKVLSDDLNTIDIIMTA